jgi:hypothetical protein
VKRAVVAVLAILALSVCHRDAPAAKRPARVTTTNIPSDERHQKVSTLVKPVLPHFVQASRLGAKLGADGSVSEEATTFTEGEPVYLTLELRESPPGLQTHAIWMTAARKQIREELRDMNGAKTVTFALQDRLKPGHYRVEGYWGGNLAAEKEFDVVAPSKKKKG